MRPTRGARGYPFLPLQLQPQLGDVCIAQAGSGGSLGLLHAGKRAYPRLIAIPGAVAAPANMAVAVAFRVARHVSVTQPGLHRPDLAGASGHNAVRRHRPINGLDQLRAERTGRGLRLNLGFGVKSRSKPDLYARYFGRGRWGSFRARFALALFGGRLERGRSLRVAGSFCVFTHLCLWSPRTRTYQAPGSSVAPAVHYYIVERAASYDGAKPLTCMMYAPRFPYCRRGKKTNNLYTITLTGVERQEPGAAPVFANNCSFLYNRHGILS